jgi:hypothetical protein
LGRSRPSRVRSRIAADQAARIAARATNTRCAELVATGSAARNQASVIGSPLPPGSPAFKRITRRPRPVRSGSRSLGCSPTLLNRWPVCKGTERLARRWPEEVLADREQHADRRLSLARLREALVGKAFCVVDMSLLSSRRGCAYPKSSSEKGIVAGHESGITSGTSWTPLQIRCLRCSLRAPSAMS